MERLFSLARSPRRAWFAAWVVLALALQMLAVCVSTAHAARQWASGPMDWGSICMSSTSAPLLGTDARPDGKAAGGLPSPGVGVACAFCALGSTANAAPLPVAPGDSLRAPLALLALAHTSDAPAPARHLLWGSGGPPRAPPTAQA